MEKQNEQICALPPHPCRFGIAEPQPATRAKIQLPQFLEDKQDQPERKPKPWSVFEGVYWI